MEKFNVQLVIDILSGLDSSSQLDAEKIDNAIDALEEIKSTIDSEDDEAIDNVDEIQDYLQYLLTIKEPLLDEIKEEISSMMNRLQASSK